MKVIISNEVFLFLFIGLFVSFTIQSNEMDHQHGMHMTDMEQHDMKESTMNHEMHDIAQIPPIGIMGGVVHMKGHFMMSIRQMRMNMEGNSDNGKNLSDAEVINLSNPYTMMNMPSKLSVVPQKMEMNMTMIGGMYGLSDRQTLMFMGMYTEKDMSLLTYSPMMNRTLLGSFITQSQGLKSVSISTLLKLKEENGFKMHAEIGIEKSIGDNDDYGEVLTPMNMKQDIMLPYSMQIGDESTSMIVGFTLLKKNQDWSFGTQLKKKNNLKKKEWNFGNNFMINGWISKPVSESLSVSLRLSFLDKDPIEGRDMRIMAPIQTANPENYGGRTYEASLGINKILSQGNILGFELIIPLKQKLHGPQMERDATISLGFKKSF